MKFGPGKRDNDIIFNSIRFHLSGIPMTKENIEYVREQVSKKREILKKKYEHMAEIYNQRNDVDPKTNQLKIPRKYSDKIIQELLTVLNDKSNSLDPQYIGLKKLFSEKSGLSIQELERETTREELEEFFKTMNGPKGKKLKKELDVLLSDDKLKQIGIDPELYNPNLIDEELLKETLRENGVDHLKQRDLKDVEQLRKKIRQEMEQNPQLAAFAKEHIGEDVEQLLTRREQDIKNGKFEKFMHREDLTDIIYKLNQQRLEKVNHGKRTLSKTSDKELS